MTDKRQRVQGRGCVVRGHNIDTDRIIPARYLRCVTFDGLHEHAFKDDRAHAKGDHPLDDERYQGSEILVVGHNFGSGSSREHAPQSLMRWGLQALMDAIELSPEHEIVVDLESGTVTSRAGVHQADIPEGVRQRLLEGTWNATAVLLEAGDLIEETASRLPYVSGFEA
jgi:3-isopropylmalate/(R)-2-methylmalate dehydratase small subunit